MRGGKEDEHAFKVTIRKNSTFWLSALKNRYRDYNEKMEKVYDKYNVRMTVQNVKDLTKKIYDRY